MYVCTCKEKNLHVIDCVHILEKKYLLFQNVCFFIIYMYIYVFLYKILKNSSNTRRVL